MTITGMGAWDNNSKVLITKSAQDFVHLILPGAQYLEDYSGEFHSEIIKADALLHILMDNKDRLLHLEIQTYNDKQMDYRLWEYNAEAFRKYKIPVYSIVIYLLEGGNIVKSPYTVNFGRGIVTHTFEFGVIKLWEISAEEILASGENGLLPFLPFMKNGIESEVVEKTIQALTVDRDEHNTSLLQLWKIFLGLVVKDEEKMAMIERRLSMLEEFIQSSPEYQRIKLRGLEEGLKEGLTRGVKEGIKEGIEKGRKEGIKEGNMHMLQTLVDESFPGLQELIDLKKDVLVALPRFDSFYLKLARAQNEEQARLLILAAVQNNDLK